MLKMNRIAGCLLAALITTATVHAAHAQNAPPANVTYYSPQTYNPYASNPALEQKQIQDAVNDALRQRFAAGDPDDAVVTQNGLTVLSGANNDGEDSAQQTKKKYHYDAKHGLFHGAGVPPRVFNNIDYPY